MFSEYKSSLLQIFDECFEGVKEGKSGTWFVEKKEALIPLLDSVNAENASRHPWQGVSSVAGHVRHTTYYMELAVQGLQDLEVKTDWPGSWSIQEVEETEWEDMRDHLKSTYTQLRHQIEVQTSLSEEKTTYIFANLAHAAFHLGSIRQLLFVLSSI